MKILNMLKWVLYVILFLVFTLFIGIEIFDRYLSSNKGAKWLYSEVPHANKKITFTSSGIRYLTVGDPEKQALVLIHGAPGSFFDWLSFAKRERLYDKYRLVIVERPGYGGTKPRKAEPSIKIQAERILEVIAGEEKPVVVMGHSYGGPISVIMGAMDTTNIEKVIGVSGQYDPNNEIIFKISYYIKAGIFKYLIPRFIWSSNVEKMTHKEGLNEIVPLYSQIKVPVILIHGNADTLVPYENSPYLMSFLNSDNAQLITLEGYDHPLQMQAVDYLVDYVLDENTPAPKKTPKE